MKSKQLKFYIISYGNVVVVVIFLRHINQNFTTPVSMFSRYIIQTIQFCGSSFVFTSHYSTFAVMYIPLPFFYPLQLLFHNHVFLRSEQCLYGPSVLHVFLRHKLREVMSQICWTERRTYCHLCMDRVIVLQNAY